jgi:hypothetical protein
LFMFNQRLMLKSRLVLHSLLLMAMLLSLGNCRVLCVVAVVNTAEDRHWSRQRFGLPPWRHQARHLSWLQDLQHTAWLGTYVINRLYVQATTVTKLRP